MKILKIVFKTIYWLIIIFLVVIAASTAFSVFNIPGGLRLLVVQSGSMEPTIKTGSVILVKKQDTYSIGDIISFNDVGMSSTTHRITKSNLVLGKEVFSTKGDANQGEDRQTININSILGKTIYTVPYLGYLVSFTKTQKGFIFLIVVPAVIIIFSEFLVIKKEVVQLIQKRKIKNEPAQ